MSFPLILSVFLDLKIVSFSLKSLLYSFMMSCRWLVESG